ncbi:MAG: tRNA epoxyqueuosine(34) reductase QueG [Spirochaetota bacterium]
MQLDEIRTKAEECGFDLCGMAEAKVPEADKQNIHAWIAKHFYGDMHWYPERNHIRLDFANLGFIPKSLIALACRYKDSGYDSFVQQKQIKISSYALGKDYHKVLRRKAKPLLRWLQEKNPKAKFRQSVDSLPVPEKVLAREAGLGWIGKNTNLIHPKQGSFFFLSLVLTDLELQATTKPITDRCGKCRACLDACPTQALQPYQIDARKCISYLTIESQQDVPKNLQGKLENWIYGCDICQEVCPWNRPVRPGSERAIYTEEKDFLIGEAWNKLDKENLASISEQDFTELSQESAISRISYERFQRNIRNS